MFIERERERRERQPTQSCSSSSSSWQFALAEQTLPSFSSLHLIQAPNLILIFVILETLHLQFPLSSQLNSFNTICSYHFYATEEFTTKNGSSGLLGLLAQTGISILFAFGNFIFYLVTIPFARGQKSTSHLILGFQSITSYSDWWLLKECPSVQRHLIYDEIGICFAHMIVLLAPSKMWSVKWIIHVQVDPGSISAYFYQEFDPGSCIIWLGHY